MRHTTIDRRDQPSFSRSRCVDTTHFDRLIRSLATTPSRRQALQLLVASVIGGLLGLDQLQTKAAKKGKGKGGGKGKGKRKGKKNGEPQGATRVPVQTRAAAECGTDTDGSMCACRQSSANQGIWTKINGRFLATGTCADCHGAKQCIPVVAGGVECILPCRA